MKLRRFAAFAWFVVVFNILVILWGAYVRASGSGDGCGDNWPLCHQQVIPQTGRQATAVEFFHRVTSGMALIFVIVQLVGSWRIYPKGHIVRSGARGSFIFIIIESLVGAGLVLFRLVGTDQSVYRVFAIVAHQINTLLLLGTLVLTAWWASGGAAIRWRKQGNVLGLALMMLIGMGLLGVSGAITALADTLFPSRTLLEGLLEDLNDTAHITVQMRWIHPVVAIVFWAFVSWAARQLAKMRNDAATDQLATLLPLVMFLQLGLGALNLALLTPIWLQIVHLLVADTVWVLMVLLVASALRETK